MKHIQIIGSAGLIALSAAATAAEEGESPWTSSAELGYVNVAGNTNTETLKSVFDISYEIEKWAHKAHAEALSSKTETTDAATLVTTESRSAAKWLLSGQSDYKISKLDYFYGLASYEDDRFGGFQYQAKLGAGYGRRVIDIADHKLKLEIGPGYRTYKLEAATPPATVADRQDEMLVRINAGYIWKITKTSKFTEDLTAEFGEDQDELKSVTGLTAKINSSLAMKLTYTVKRLDVVPAGTENTDKETAVTLVYTF